jgi:hypothetical protein
MPAWSLYRPAAQNLREFENAVILKTFDEVPDEFDYG